MNRRRFNRLICGAIFAAPLAGLAQPAGRVLRIAILEDISENARRHHWKAFRKRLEDLGYSEGKNLVVESRYSRGNAERLHGLAVELVALRPDVIVTSGTPPTRAVMCATSSIPIVFTSAGDPVGAGLVASLGQPGGNATGFSIMSSEIGAKWVQLLREIALGAKRIAFLGDMSNKGTLLSFSEVQGQARPLNVMVQMLDGRQRSQLERSFDTIVREHFDGLIVGASGVLLDLREKIVQFAARHKLPAVYARREFADAGGLLFYGVEQSVLFRRAAEYVHRIAQSAKPSELPVERPNVFRMVVNLKTARARYQDSAVNTASRRRSD